MTARLNCMNMLRKQRVQLQTDNLHNTFSKLVFPGTMFIVTQLNNAELNVESK